MKKLHRYGLMPDQGWKLAGAETAKAAVETPGVILRSDSIDASVVIACRTEAQAFMRRGETPRHGQQIS
jgi:hypothetical protein